MWVLFLLLALAALVCFIIGMVDPKLIVFWTKKKGRGMACLYLAAMFVFFVSSILSAPSTASSTNATVSNTSSVATNSKAVTSNTSKAASSSSQPTNKTYGVGEEAPIMQNGTKVGTLKINSVKATTDRNEFDSSNPAQVVLIDYTYTNTAYKQDLYISSVHFKVIDSNGTVSQTYPANIEKYPQNLSMGTNCEAQEAYGLANSSKSIKLNYYFNMFNSTPSISFDLNIQ